MSAKKVVTACSAGNRGLSNSQEFVRKSISLSKEEQPGALPIRWIMF